MPSQTEACRSLAMLHARMKRFKCPKRLPQEPRSGMKCWRLESETPKLFMPENSSKALQIKDVVEFSLLHSGSYAGSPEEYE